LAAKNIQHRFEQLIDSLSIKAGKEKYLRNQVNYIKNQLIKISKWTFDNPQNPIQSMSNNVEVVRFWYGGSWDRGVHINKEFDIDIYIVYDEIENFRYDFNENTLKGKILFTILYEDLETIQEKINSNLKIMESPQYSHAIPIELTYQNKVLKVDCIPAIELPHQYLLAPNGWNYIKKVNQKLTVLKDRVYPQKSILHDFNEKRIDQFYEVLQKANQLARKNQWNELFGDF